MSNHIGKYLIEIDRWGGAFPSGVVVKETERQWVLTQRVFTQRGSRQVRKFKDRSDVLLPPDADVDAAISAFDEAYRSYREEVKRLEDALQEAKRRRLDAAIAALGPSEAVS